MPSEENGFLVDHVTMMCRCYTRLTGRRLIEGELSPLDQARALFNAPFVALSHDTSDDPVFNYANQTAMTLFELTWNEITSLPSRHSAEPVNREARAMLLDEVSRHGFIDNYAGVRISKSRRRFAIEKATVWNIVDVDGFYKGQAATFAHWRFL